MKKIISLIITVLLLVSCFVFSVSADQMKSEEGWTPFDEYCELPANQNITFSDDLKTLYVGEQAYSRFNSNDVYCDYAYLVPNRKILDNTDVEELDLSSNKKGNIIYATFYFKDGAELSCSFIDDRYLDEVNDIIKDKNEDLFIEFNLQGEEYYKVEAQKLKGKKIKLKTEDFWHDSEEFSVLASTSDKSITVSKGCIYVLEDKVYYGANGENEENLFEDGETWDLYEITDKSVIEEIKAKQKEYYAESDYGVLMDEEILQKVSKVFFVIFFIILPFAVMVVSIVFAIRSKKPIYKKMYIITSIIAGAQTVIFVISSLILFK